MQVVQSVGLQTRSMLRFISSTTTNARRFHLISQDTTRFGLYLNKSVRSPLKTITPLNRYFATVSPVDIIMGPIYGDKEKGTLSKWSKEVGSFCEQYDIIGEITALDGTVIEELPTPIAGELVQQMVEEGDDVKVGDVLARIMPKEKANATSKSTEKFSSKKSVERGFDRATDSLKQGGASLKTYVMGIPFDSNEGDLKAFFKGCDVSEVIFDENKKGAAFVTFSSQKGYETGLAKDGEYLGDRYLKVKPDGAKTDRKPFGEREATPYSQGCTTLFVANLGFETDEESLANFFRDFAVKEVRFLNDKLTGEFKGVGFVEFEDTESCKEAIRLNGNQFLGRPIRLDFAETKRRDNFGGGNDRGPRKSFGGSGSGERGSFGGARNSFREERGGYGGERKSFGGDKRGKERNDFGRSGSGRDRDEFGSNKKPRGNFRGDR